MCAFSVAPASGPMLEEQCHPQGAPKVPAATQAQCPCFATYVWHRQVPASHSISSKPGPLPRSQQAKLGEGLMNISKMQLKSSPSIRNIYSLSYNTARKTLAQEENCWESCEKVIPGGCQGPGAESRRWAKEGE